VGANATMHKKSVPSKSLVGKEKVVHNQLSKKIEARYEEFSKRRETRKKEMQKRHEEFSKHRETRKKEMQKRHEELTKHDIIKR